MNKAKLKIGLLGGLTIHKAELPVTGFASRKAEALLIYLACHPRPHPRESLAALLWPENDQTRALGNLSVALNSLKKQLEPYILAERRAITFNDGANYELDTAVFQQTIRAAQDQQQAGGKLGRTGAIQLQTAVSLYHGDFLAGFNVRNAPEFEAWALLEQERLRQMFLTALADLITFHQRRGQLAAAIGCAQRLLAADPLQENIHRQLMSLYVQDNQRPAALSQYEQCARILDEELRIEPDEETASLYEAIKKDKERESRGERENAYPTPTPLTFPAPPHNIPAATNAFIGREGELTTIAGWLGEPNGRLLTITGSGGMGKTRLAQEAARACRGQFADGVWLVSLVAFRDWQGAAMAVAAAPGLILSGIEDLQTQLLNRLQPLEALLVLDNLEHLLSDDLRQFLSQLSHTAPDLRLIVTSRERLRLQAERVLSLEGLPFPENSLQSSVVSRQSSISNDPLPITNYPAVQLFIDRAKRAQAGFDGEREATAVARLCQLTGGLPLALELAATWTPVLSVAEIVAEIEAGLDRLTTPLHDVPERHRSLRAVIESSWQALPAVERKLFRRLAVFRGGFSRAAAEQVAQANLPQLLSLVDRSFLRLDSDQRFRRHPLLLQFAQEQLAAQPEERAETEAAHGRFFAELVTGQEEALQGSATREALALLETDLENIRAAWQWGLRMVDTETLEPLVMGLSRFYGGRGRPLEGVLLFAPGLQALEQASGIEPVIVKMQVELGYFLDQTGRLAEAEAILLAAEPKAAQRQLHHTRIECLRNLGVVAQHKGDWDICLSRLEEARQLCQTHGKTEDMLPILNDLGNLWVNKGDFDRGRAYFEEAVTLAKKIGNTLRLAILQGNMGIIANRQNDYEEAIRQWRLAEAGFRVHNHEVGLANITFNIAMALHGLGKYEEALEDIQKAHMLMGRLGQRQGAAAGLGVMGMIYHKMGKHRAARHYLRDSLLQCQEIGSQNLAISSVAELAEVEISDGNMARAAFLLIFIVDHPATGGVTREKCQQLLDELRAELSPKLMAEAETASANQTLDSLIAWLKKESPL